MLDTTLLNKRIALLGVSIEVLARLADTSETVMRQVLRGTRRDNTVLIKAHNAIKSVEDLVETCKPIPISFRNADSLKNILDLIASERLRIEVVCQEVGNAAEA